MNKIDKSQYEVRNIDPQNVELLEQLINQGFIITAVTKNDDELGTISYHFVDYILHSGNVATFQCDNKVLLQPDIISLQAIKPMYTSDFAYALKYTLISCLWKCQEESNHYFSMNAKRSRYYEELSESHVGDNCNPFVLASFSSMIVAVWASHDYDRQWLRNYIDTIPLKINRFIDYYSCDNKESKLSQPDHKLPESSVDSQRTAKQFTQFYSFVQTDRDIQYMLFNHVDSNVLDSVGIDKNDVSAMFTLVGNCEYTEIWVTDNNRYFETNTIYTQVL